LYGDYALSEVGTRLREIAGSRALPERLGEGKPLVTWFLRLESKREYKR